MRGADQNKFGDRRQPAFGAPSGQDQDDARCPVQERFYHRGGEYGMFQIGCFLLNSDQCLRTQKQLYFDTIITIWRFSKKEVHLMRVGKFFRL
jgi:hypothetical protein